MGRFNKDMLMRAAVQFGVAVIAVAVASFLRFALEAWAGSDLPTYITFYPAVMVVAVLFGLRAGLAATVLSWAAADYWFIGPSGSFLVYPTMGDAVGVPLFLAMGAFMSIVAESYRRNRLKAANLQRELAVREGEIKFRQMANSIPQLAWIAKPDGSISWYNQRWYDYTGAAEQRMEGGGWQSVLDPDVQPKVLEEWKASIATGRPFEMTFPLRGSDGAFRPFLTRIMPLKDQRGRVLQWFGTHTDITDHVEAERALQEMTRQLQAQSDELARQNEELAQQAEELSQQTEEMAHQNEELQGQSEIVQSLNSELTHRESLLQTLLESTRMAASEQAVMADICRAGLALFGPVAANVAVFEMQSGQLRLRAFVGSGEGKPPHESWDVGHAFCTLIAGQGKTGCLNDTSMRPDLSVFRIEGEPPPAASLCSPLMVAGQVWGTVGIYSYDRQEWTEEHFRLAEWLAGQCAHIMETLRVQEALRRSEQQLRTILDSLPIAVFLSDPAGNIVFTNTAVQRIWGISTHVTRDRYGDYKARWYATGKPVEPDDWALARVLETKQPCVNELVEVDAEGGGRRILQNQALPICAASGELLGSLVVTENVTERVESQEKLRLAKETAEQTAIELGRSNRDLEQFAYVASHDLQEPLRMVSGFVGMLRDRYRDKIDAKGLEYVDYAVDGAIRMQNLVTDLLAFSRAGRGTTMRPINVAAALESAMANLKAAIDESGAVVTSDELPTVLGDRSQLTQLLQNLISNAIKFRGQSPPRIHCGVRRDGKNWTFSVRDNGIGIEREHFDKIFLIFQRLHTRQSYPGTGVGLAICKRIIERHGGRIWLESEPGKGTTFYFTLQHAEVEQR